MQAIRFFVMPCIGLLAMLAFGQQNQDQSKQSDSTRAAESQSDSPSAQRHSSTATSDSEFLKKAASSGMMEVELGQLAEQKGFSDRVKRIGQRLVRDHSKANDKLKKVAASAGVTLPSEMDAQHKEHVDHLQGLSGAEFDKAFLEMQAEHHREDIAEFNNAAKTGQNADVRQFASKTVPVLEKHLRMIEGGQGAAAREETTGSSESGSAGRSRESNPDNTRNQQ